MDSSKSTLLHDSIASTRRRNRTLIAITFFLIISLALIIDGIVFSFVLKYDFKSQSPNTNPAVKEFCAASESMLNCSNSLSSSIKTTRHTDPTLVYTLSLEAALHKLSHVDSIVSRSNSNHTRIDSALRNCWSSLRLGMRGLGGVLAVMRVDPVIETQAFEQRGSTVLLIEKAMEALRRLDRRSWMGRGRECTKSRCCCETADISSRILTESSHISKPVLNCWSTCNVLNYVADVSLFGVAMLGLDF